MDVDEALHKIGDFGRGQILILITIGALSLMAPCWVVLGITILAAFPDHFCTVPRDSNVDDYIPYVEINGEYVYDSCTQYVNPGSSDNLTAPCSNGWTFSTTPFGSTIVSEWDLVCDRTQLAALAQSVLILGVMVGSVIFGYLSDRIGRKPVLMFSSFCQGCLGIVLSLSPTFWFFLIIRFIMGIINQLVNCSDIPYYWYMEDLLINNLGCVMPGYALVSEFFSPTKRAIGFNLFAGFFPIGVMILALLAFFIRDWRYLQLAITLPFFVFSFICWFVPESPRWLVSVGKFQEASTILTKLALFNGSKVDSVSIGRKPFRNCGIDNKSFIDSKTKESGKYDQEETKETCSNDMTTVSKQVAQSGMKKKKKSKEINSKPTTTKSFTFLYLCKTPRMSLITIVMTLTWLATAFSFNGLSLNSVRLAGSPYLNLFLTGAIEIPANFVATTLAVRFGRRKPLCLLLIVSSIVCVVTGFIPTQKGNGLDLTAAIMTFAVAGKFFVASSYVIVILYATEVFPTVVRNKGMAVAVMTARIGPLLAPFIVLLDEIHHSLPIIIFGVASAIPSLFVLLLPETQGRSQPETAEDIDLMYREEKLRVLVATTSRGDRGRP